MRLGNIQKLCNETDTQQLKKKIKFLQTALLQISFNQQQDRLMLFKALLKSLNSAQRTLRNLQATNNGEFHYGK